MKTTLSLLCTLILLGACGGSQVPENRAEYEVHLNTIKKFSEGDEINKGLYNRFAFKATLLNSTVSESILKEKANYYKWSTPKLLSEREKNEQLRSSSTSVFMSFYTPDRQDDNFTDKKNSIWKIYLEANGQRYEGKAKRDRRRITELNKIYPYHSRWASAYSVTFNVPTSAIEQRNAKFTVTGPLGTKVVNFVPVGP